MHCQVKHHQNPSRAGHCSYKHQDDRDRVEGCDVRNHRGQYGNYVLSNNTAEKNFSHGEKWQGQPQDEHQYGHQENYYSRQVERNNYNSLREGHYFGNHKGDKHHYCNKIDGHYSSYLVRNCHSAQEGCSASHTNGFISSNRRGNGGKPNGCPSPSPHHQEVVTAFQPQLGDYISADEECYCYRPPSQTENTHNQSTALYHGPTVSDGVPSPLYGDDSPYTILNTLDTTEPITAIFMGFQAAQDDSDQSQEFVGSLKAELVIIEDNEQNGEDNDVKRKKGHAWPVVSSYSTESAASGNLGCVEGRTERQTAPGIRKIKKHKPCCTVC